MTNPWYRMDQLLKCSLCSSKYRNPKLLPCNHTFCSEPCLEKLLDRSKQQLKCPECSAEHRVPHGGVHAFPNNVTLGRFLELRQQVSGREPELPPSMQRCNTCKEKGQLEMCAHCSRKVCKDCKTAHINILRKEIALINEQVRQGLKQLSGILHKTEEKADKIQKNYVQVKDEIEEVVRRYTRDLLDTEAKLKSDLDAYLNTELRSMQRLEHDLQIEMNNVNSNCDLVDKYVNNGVDWTDAELTDYKEIFLKTLDFLRTFDTDPTDCLRKVKFHPRADPDVVHKTLIDFAEVKLNDDVNNNNILNSANDNGFGNLNQGSGPSLTLTPPQTNAIARSQSDNRLANQRPGRNKNDDGDRDTRDTTYSRRRFTRDRDSCERELNPREDRDYLGVSSWRRELDEARSNQKTRFGSREYIEEADSYEKEPSPSRRGVRFEERQVIGPRGRDHVVGTEDATKGPLSGVIKILDSPHVMERLHHSEVRQKKMKEEAERRAKQPPPPPPRVNRAVNRQMSEDEIEKQKKENKAAAAAAATATSATNTTSTTTLHKEKSTVPDAYTRSRTTQDSDSRSSFVSRTSAFRPSLEDYSKAQKAKIAEDTIASRRRTVDEEPPVPAPRLRPWRTSSPNTDKERIHSPPGSPTRGTRETQKPPVSPRQRDVQSVVKPSRPYLTKASSLDHDDRPTAVSPPPRRTLESVGRAGSLEHRDTSRAGLRLNMPQRTELAVDSSDSSSSESESSEDSDTAARRGDISPSVNTLLARSAQARRQSASTQARLLGRSEDDKKRSSTTRSWRDPVRNDDSREKSGSPRRRLTSTTAAEPEERISPYSRFLADRRRSSVTSASRYGKEDSPEDRFRTGDSSYSGSAARRNRISRSKSSHDLLPCDDSPDEDSLSGIRNRYRTKNSRDKSPEDTTSSWSQYLKNKYGGGGNRSSGSTTNNAISRSRTSSGLALRSCSDNSSDEDSTSRRRDFRRRGDSNSPRGFSMPRRTYMSKGKPTLKIGSRGTDPGFFTWPRGVCVGPDNTIVVADSSNHRIQVFHSTGKLIQEFGSYGSNEGEFDCLAAVTVNRIGQFIVSDRYNHRVQVFDPSGRFVRSFGSEGRGEGKFSYPWGVATDNLGFIYVCDKENHRVQVFQGDGTYVTKFGSIGQRPGELEHPHYVAVSTTNRVIVSDSNNHRIQIFDVNGRLLSTFGNEGSEEGQFKYPRGVAVDDQGYLIVGDSGNNRIQVFHPDGTFLKAFGTWGSGEGEFKGLEGVAVTPCGQILVCDRENHRIQVF